MAESFIAALAPHLQKIKEPCQGDKIHKDECVYSFDSPDSETGLYVCLQTFLGLGKGYIHYHYQRTGSSVYLHLRRDKIEHENKQGDGPERKVTRLAIGLEGGFDPDHTNFEVSESASIVIFPDFISVPWPGDGLPDKLVKCVQKIFEYESATKVAEVESVSGTWDGEARVVSKHAKNLLQLDNGVKVPPSGWKCGKCDLETNLWLNLSDGSILCGRKFYDGTGGNEHALEHYKTTGYPLAVKLGTITKEGKGDVYSYEEDDMVHDPYLITHLAHFGINIQNLEKTDKSMAELELDLNQKLGEWSTLQESGSNLEPLYGAGRVGLANMGNSCYLNSVVQVVFSIPDFIVKYYNDREDILRNSPSDPASDFNIQMSKLGHGLLSDKYSIRPSLEFPRKVYPPVTPAMFKHLIGRNHPDFSTKNQQDAQEFLLHLLNHVQRNSRGNKDPTECFKMQVEDRFECSTSGKVKYNLRTEYCLPLPIPLGEATNMAQVLQYEEKKAKGEKMESVEIVRPKLKLSSCIDAFSQTETVEQFFSSAINAKTTAKKTTRLSTMPDYLLLHMRKFTVKENWVEVKLDVEVEMPEVLDVGCLRGGKGELRPGEEALPASTSAPALPPVNQQHVACLQSMGFTSGAISKALYYTQNRGLDAAAQWLTEHANDIDFNSPFVPPGTRPAGFVPNEEGLSLLTAMGFTRAQATKALQATDNDVERAGDWIFSHAEELDEPSQPSQPQFRDGPSVYNLKAFISHMGTSSMVGHYVCHIKKDGQWIIYNDEKVARSENPPKDLGYLYLYERVTT